MNEVQEAYQRERACACADHVDAVEPPYIARHKEEPQRDARGHEQERDSQHEIQAGEPKQLAGLGCQFECFKGNALRQCMARDQRDREQDRCETQQPCLAPRDPLAQHGKDSAARAEAEHGHTDDHVGEMMPLRNAEDAH